MQTIVAGLMALTAMGASVLADVDPLGTVGRGAAAYVVGLLLSSIWVMVVNPQDAKKKKEKETEESEDEGEVESEESDDKEDQEDAA